MTAFLDTAGRYALLTKREEIELGRRIQRWLQWDEEANGPCPRAVERSGRRAREKFILCNLRLVAKVCKSYTRRLYGTGFSFEDILQEGTVGLARAAEKYDPECGYAMSTYATWWIRQAVSRALESRGSLIKVGTQPRRNLYKLQRLIIEGVPVAEAANQLELSNKQLELVQCASVGMRVRSLDAAVDNGLAI